VKILEEVLGGGATFLTHMETLRAKIDRKSAISLQRSQFDPKLQVEWVASHQLFLHG